MIRSATFPLLLLAALFFRFTPTACAQTADSFAFNPDPPTAGEPVEFRIGLHGFWFAQSVRFEPSGSDLRIVVIGEQAIAPFLGFVTFSFDLSAPPAGLYDYEVVFVSALTNEQMAVLGNGQLIVQGAPLALPRAIPSTNRAVLMVLGMLLLAVAALKLPSVTKGS